MNTYYIIIGCLIVGYIILLFITSKQNDIITAQELNIKLLNGCYKGIKQTCECCQNLHKEEVVGYISQINADEELINILRKRLDEERRW